MSNPKPPTRGARTAALQELDRFSTADLQRWRTASEQLDELNAALYFATEPDRRRIRHKLIAALQGAPVHVHSFENWIRSVTYEHSLQPLSSAGSLTDIGGRFNTGYELDEGTLGPWPALYIAQDLETAYREKFGLTSADRVDGLTGEELALEGKISHSNVVLRGRIERVFEMTNFTSLNSFGRLLGKIKMPRQAEVLKKDLKIPAHELTMVKNGEQLFNLVTKMNWRVNPRQFGLPAQSQILADFVRAAGFDAILYQSSKGPGKCLAIFPDKLSGGSYVELMHRPVHPSTKTRLDTKTASDLEGWEVLPRNRR